MAKMIEFDLSGADEEVWDQSEGTISEEPKPGIYQARIREINTGYSKDSDGKPDKSRPRLEVICEIIGDSKGDREPLEKLGIDGGDCYNSWVWDYVSFSEASEWKQAQFYRAIGEGNPKKKKGKFNAEKHEGKTLVRIRVKKSSNLEGDYRAKVGAMWAWKDNDDTGIDDDDLDDELDQDLPDPEDLSGMKVKDLRTLAKNNDVDVTGQKKAEIVETLLDELYDEEEDDDDDDDFEDDDDELEDDEEEEENELTEDDINEMSAQELKELAKENGISLKGMKKSEARETLIDELVDDVPF